jgi:hypothetical protein
MIHTIITTGNIAHDYETRKAEYINGVNSVITNYNLKPFIVECVQATDFLNEDFVGHSNYSENQGINEFINVDEFFKANDSKFQDDDVIIKMTGRYEIVSPYLVDFIKQNQYDVYCKTSTDIYGPADTGIHVFLIAMTYRCWKEFLRQHFTRDVPRDHPVEWQFADYVKTKNTVYMDKLGMLASPRSLRRTFRV